MKRVSSITTLFLDIGGVLLTNGWDGLARKRAAAKFRLEWADLGFGIKGGSDHEDEYTFPRTAS